MSKTENTPATTDARVKIVIFEEADGFHWNTQRSIDAMGAYDATGKGYPSRRKAMQAAKVHLSQNAGL